MPTEPTIDDIDACEWLYLETITGAPGNSLRLRIDEASTRPHRPDDDRVLDGFPPGDREAVAAIFSGSNPIEHGVGDRTFEVTWEQCTAFAVADETYYVGETAAPLSGTSNIREFSESAFLAYVAESTWDPGDDQRRHWSIYTLNHCIDVVATAPPSIRLIGPINVRPSG